MAKATEDLKAAGMVTAVLGVGSAIGYLAKAKKVQEPEQAQMRAEEVFDAVAAVRKVIGAPIIVCVLGGVTFQHGESEDLVKAFAKEFAKRVPKEAAFVTAGLPGIQETFAKNCGDGARLWNLVPSGCCSAYGSGTDVMVGASLVECRALFRELGDIYVTVEGGQGVALDAQIAYDKGAVVLPLSRTGGASSGDFNFPSHPLNKPPYIAIETWEAMSQRQASVSDAALAVTTAVADAVPLKILERGQVAETLMEIKDVATATSRALEGVVIQTEVSTETAVAMLERAMTGDDRVPLTISRTTSLKEGTSSLEPPSGNPPTDGEQRSVASILASAASRTATALRNYALGGPTVEASGGGGAENVQQAIDRMRTGPIEEEPTVTDEKDTARTDAPGTPQVDGSSRRVESPPAASRQSTGESLQVTNQTVEQRVAHRCCCDQHRHQCWLL